MQPRSNSLYFQLLILILLRHLASQTIGTEVLTRLIDDIGIVDAKQMNIIIGHSCVAIVQMLHMYSYMNVQK